MAIAIKNIFDANPFYVYFKPHFCPKCNSKLETKYNSIIVNSKSPEAKNYDFSCGDTYFIGDVEFRIKMFHCSKCGFEISFKDMRVIEKGNSNPKK